VVLVGNREFGWNTSEARLCDDGGRQNGGDI
jgi:hypothetical protein